MKKRMICFLIVLPMIVLLAVPMAYAQEDEGVVVYRQDFEKIVDSKGNGYTDNKIKERDTTFTAVGNNAASATKAAVVYAGKESVRIIENFDSITSLESNKVFKLTNNAGADGAKVSVTEKALKLEKTVGGSGKSIILDTELGGYVRTLPAYAVEMDLKANFINEGLTLQFTIGADFAFRQVKGQGNKCTFEWHDKASNAWVKDEEHLYDLTDYQHLTFVVNADKTVDAYIGSGEARQLMKSGVLQRGSNAFTTLKYTMGNSLTATTWLDNFAFTSVLPGQEAEEETPSENRVLRLEKLAKGAGAESKMDLTKYLCGSQDYTYSFDLQMDTAAGFSANVVLGAFVQIKTSDSGYNVLSHIGGSAPGVDASFELQGNYSFDTPVNVALRVHADAGTADLYIGGELVKSGIPPRDGYRFDEWRFVLNNSSLGASYLDNFALTLNDVKTVTSDSVTADAAEIDFEDFTTGVLQDGTGGFTTNCTPALGLMNVADAPTDAAGTAHGKALRMLSMTTGDNTNPATYILSRDYSHLVDDALTYTTEFDLLLSGKGSYNIAEKTSGGGFKTNFDLTGDTLIKYQPLSGWVESDKTFQPNIWFKVKYVVDTQTNTADVYFNDELLVEDLPAYDKGVYGGLAIATNNGTVGELWLDNFKMTVTEEKLPGASVSGTAANGSLNITAYSPAEAGNAKVFAAYFSGDMLMDVAVLDCTAGEKLIQTLAVPTDKGITKAKLFLWSELLPLCNNTDVLIEQ